MNGGGGDGGAKKSEARRQSRINRGLTQINAIYGGGPATTYSAANTYDPANKYYVQAQNGQYLEYVPPAKPTPVVLGQFPKFSNTNPNPKAGLNNGMGFGGYQAQITPEDLARQGKLFTAQTQTYPGFTPDFYDQRKQAFINYANPQLMQQYEQSRKNLIYQLARGGNLQSSSGIDLSGKLQQQLGSNQRSIADEGQNQANELRQTVEGNRQTAINQLYASADPAQAASTAIAGARIDAQPSTYQPLGDLFAQWSNIYNQNRTAQAYNPNVPNLFGQPQTRPVGSGGGSSMRIVQ